LPVSWDCGIGTPFTRTVAVHVAPWPGRSVVGPEIMTCMVGEGVGEGVTTDGVDVGLGVGLIIDAAADGVADADFVVFVVVFAVFAAALDALLATWLLFVDDVQPATMSDATITSATTATFLLIDFALCLLPRHLAPYYELVRL
jgi:hypothetical protein